MFLGMNIYRVTINYLKVNAEGLKHPLGTPVYIHDLNKVYYHFSCINPRFECSNCTYLNAHSLCSLDPGLTVLQLLAAVQVGPAGNLAAQRVYNGAQVVTVIPVSLKHVARGICYIARSPQKSNVFDTQTLMQEILELKRLFFSPSLR